MSEQFELMARIEAAQAVLYLDHAADNSPAPDATLELELAASPWPTRWARACTAELSQPLADGETR